MFFIKWCKIIFDFHQSLLIISQFVSHELNGGQQSGWGLQVHKLTVIMVRIYNNKGQLLQNYIILKRILKNFQYFLSLCFIPLNLYKDNLNLIMQSKETKIYAQIDHLITTIHKNASEELKSNIQSFARKVFSSGSGRPNTDTIADLKQKITVKVTNTHDQRSVLQCQDITQRFLNNSTIHKKQQVLRMLLKLSQLNNKSEEDLTNVFRQVRKKELNTTIETNLSNFTQIIPQPRRTGQFGQQLKIIRNRGSIQQGISESDLVKQLSFVFTNTSSNEIIETTEGYQLKNSINVTQTVRKMISEMSDLGWLHKKIMKYSQKDGTIRKALRLAIHEELNQYYRWIGTMQNLVKDNKLTLRKLYIWSFYPQQILKWLAIILQAVQPFDGCHIISIVNSYRPNGLTAVNGLINRILAYILQPLLNYIHRWIYKGELLDSRNQFFIAQNKKVYQSQQWNERFKLINENIPNILNSESAKMIFNTGKAIYFLINKCKVLYNVKTPFIDTKNLQNISVQGSNTLISPAFMNWLTAVHNQVNKVLVQTLFNQFHLKYHLQSIKHFFLVGKGDFIQHLYDNLKDKLSQKKQQVSQHSLDGYISDAILKCFNDYKMPDNVNYFRSSIVDRLLAKKIEFGTGTEAWDCFNFQYSLERIQPLQTIFSPDIMINYQKIFNFLWKIKQIQEILKDLWVLQSREQSLKMRKIKSSKLHSIFHLAYILRNTMSHFITNLHSYLMVTIQACWNRFWQEIAQNKSFDDILKKHKEFQHQILQITLNTPPLKNVLVAINNIFTTVTNFKKTYDYLQQNFDEYYEKRRLYEDRQSMAKRGITIEYLQIPQINLIKSQKDLRLVKQSFDTTFRNLFMQIRKDSQSKITSLNVLSAKLDFSEFYTNLYIE